MRRSSGRGQVEPLAALAAVLAVSAGIVVYAGLLDDAVPGNAEAETPSAILDRVHRTAQQTGVVAPDRLDAALAAVPDGWHANVTVTSGGRRWSRGPAPPEGADRARRRVSVRPAPGEVSPGQLRVVVWR